MKIDVSDSVTLFRGDNLDVLRNMPDCSVDSVVTDPPYGLEFMQKAWDAPWKSAITKTGYTDGAERLPRPSHSSTRNPVCQACHKHKRGKICCSCESPEFDESPADSSRLYGQWCEVWAREVYRVLKPGGHMLAFGGTRMYHRLACAIEDAGFEIRDSIRSSGWTFDAMSWLYLSGFPKGRNISKDIDALVGAERKVVGFDASRARPNRLYEGGAIGNVGGTGKPSDRTDNGATITEAGSDEAKTWEGWSTTLKPAWEPIIVARKALEGTVAQNVLKWGTGGINLDACRVACVSESDFASAAPGGQATAKSGALAGGTENDNERATFKPKIDRKALSNHSRGGESAKSKGIYGDSSEQETHQTEGQKLGRHPPNLLLCHHPDCRKIGTKTLQASSGIRPKDVGTDYGKEHKSGSMSGAKGVMLAATYCDAEGNETVTAYECVDSCPVKALDGQSGTLSPGHHPSARGVGSQISGPSGHTGQEGLDDRYEASGGASRIFPQFTFDDDFAEADALDFVPFLYTPKAARGERELGCAGLPTKNGISNSHPTVKPVALMRWLLKLVTPPGGLVLDPFAGSFTTGVAAVREGFRFVGIDLDKGNDGEPASYLAIGEARIRYALTHAEVAPKAKRKVGSPKSAPVPSPPPPPAPTCTKEENPSPAVAEPPAGPSLSDFLSRLRSA